MNAGSGSTLSVFNSSVPCRIWGAGTSITPTFQPLNSAVPPPPLQTLGTNLIRNQTREERLKGWITWQSSSCLHSGWLCGNSLLNFYIPTHAQIKPTRTPCKARYTTKNSTHYIKPSTPNQPTKLEDRYPLHWSTAPLKPKPYTLHAKP